MKWLDNFAKKTENITISLQDKTIKLQKNELNKQKLIIRSLQGLLTHVMRKHGYSRSQIFAAIHTGEIVDNDIQKGK